MTRYFRTVAGLTASSAVALTLGACKLENRPLFGRDEARAPYEGAPALGPLDPTYSQGAAYLPPAQAYAYPERAYGVSRAAYARPPTYAFAYGDEQPWAWEVADEGLMFAEPYGDDWRYYYYEPGEDYPYYVQDADYGYAYGDDGTLIALFTAAGLLLAADRYDDHWPRAGYYWTRGSDLNRTYWRAPRYRVEEAVWRDRHPRIFANHDRWYQAFEAQPGWREAVRHDNGLHLGWYKDRAGRGDGRKLAFAAPPQRFDGGRRHGPEERVAREGREPQHVRVPPDSRPETRGPPAAFRQARHGEGGGPHAQRDAKAQARAQESGGGWRDARQGGGPQQQARDAGAHGRNAGWKGQDRPQAQPGGRGHGGGDGGGPGGGKGADQGGHGGGGGHGHGGDGGGGGKHR